MGVSGRILTRGDRVELRKLIVDNGENDRKKIESQAPNWKHEVSEKAKKMAVTELGIGAMMAKLKKIEDEREKLTKDRDKLELSVRQKLPFEEGRYHNSCPDRMSICKALAQIGDKLEEKVLEKHPIAKKLLKIDEDTNRRIADLMKCTTREDVKECGCLDW